nr:MAG TPA: hypothetical protein [Caudoviricetes sp.]
MLKLKRRLRLSLRASRQVKMNTLRILEFT